MITRCLRSEGAIAVVDSRFTPQLQGRQRELVAQFVRATSRVHGPLRTRYDDGLRADLRAVVQAGRRRDALRRCVVAFNLLVGRNRCGQVLGLPNPTVTFGGPLLLTALLRRGKFFDSPSALSCL
jgi:hypothetical protein